MKFSLDLELIEREKLVYDRYRADLLTKTKEEEIVVIERVVINML